MLYFSWDMACDRCNCYFPFWTTFCPFTPLTDQKIKFYKKWRKGLEISSFYTIAPKTMIICYTVPKIWQVTDNSFSFWAIFCPFTPPHSPKNQNFKKMKKKAWRYHYFTIMCQKSWSYAILFPRYGAWQM